MKRLAAIVTSYNRADFIGICCQSICAAAGPGLELQVIVMDNGSTDTTGAVAKAVDPRVRIVRTEDNRSVVEVINRGFRAAYEDPEVTHVLLLNDDIEFLPGAIAALLEASDAHPHAVLTPLQLNYHQRGQVDANAYAHVVGCRDLVEDAVLGRPLRKTYPQITIIGAAMLAPRAVWQAIGEFDELFWFTGSDDDYCNRAHWLGYEVLLVPAAHMYHAHGGLTPHHGGPSKAAEHRRYRLGLQARYLFLFKDMRYGLPRATFNATLSCLETFLGCALRLWFYGMYQSLAIYLHCLHVLPQIAATRKRHYDPANRRPTV